MTRSILIIFMALSCSVSLMASEDAVFKYVRSRLHDELEKYLKHDSSAVNKENDKGKRPLHIAALNGDREAIELLLKNGASPQLRDKKGYAPLHDAANNGDPGVIELLIQSGKDLDLVTSEKELTPLHLAAGQGRLEALKMLVANGARVDKGDIEEKAALHFAAEEGHRECVLFLVSKGADPYGKSKEGLTPIDLAKKNKHPALAYEISGAVGLWAPTMLNIVGLANLAGFLLTVRSPGDARQKAIVAMCQAIGAAVAFIYNPLDYLFQEKSSAVDEEELTKQDEL